jgi:hypothetical protein
MRKEEWFCPYFLADDHDVDDACGFGNAIAIKYHCADFLNW